MLFRSAGMRQALRVSVGLAVATPTFALLQATLLLLGTLSYIVYEFLGKCVLLNTSHVHDES